MTQITWNKPDFEGVRSHDGRWSLQASRDINGKAISWSVFDQNTNPEWLEDRLIEVTRLAEAKAWVQNYVGEHINVDSLVINP